MRVVIFIALAAVLLSGCGSRVVDRSRSATRPYDGQLGAGAAVGALECEGKTPYWRGKGVYDDGLAKVQESAEAALDDYMSEAGLGLVIPSDGYAVERDQDAQIRSASSTSAFTREFSGMLHTTFSDQATLPADATDTGLRRDGRQLWIGPDEKAAYLVSLEDGEDVERWPAAKRRIGCA